MNLCYKTTMKINLVSLHEIKRTLIKPTKCIVSCLSRSNRRNKGQGIWMLVPNPFGGKKNKLT